MKVCRVNNIILIIGHPVTLSLILDNVYNHTNLIYCVKNLIAI